MIDNLIRNIDAYLRLLKLELSSRHGDRLKHLARLETNLARLRPLLVADAAVAKYKIDITQAQEHLRRVMSRPS